MGWFYQILRRELEVNGCESLSGNINILARLNLPWLKKKKFQPQLKTKNQKKPRVTSLPLRKLCKKFKRWTRMTSLWLGTSKCYSPVRGQQVSQEKVIITFFNIG